MLNVRQLDVAVFVLVQLAELLQHSPTDTMRLLVDEYHDALDFIFFLVLLYAQVGLVLRDDALDDLLSDAFEVLELHHA